MLNWVVSRRRGAAFRNAAYIVLEPVRRIGRPALGALRGAVLVCLVVYGGAAFAVDPTSCTDLTTTPTIGGAVTCIVDTVNPYSVMTGLIVVFLPVFMVLWGLKGGFGLVKQVVRGAFGFLRK